MDQRKYSWSHLKYFYALVVISFIVVSLPLITTTVTGFNYVDKLTDQSQVAVSRAVKTTQLSRQLLNQSTAMERSARQYVVLGNKTILDNYFSLHETYLETAQKLADITLSNTLREQLSSLNTLEASLYETLRAAESDSEQKKEINPQDFIAMSQLAGAILTDSDKLIDSELRVMESLSNEARNTMNQQLLWLAPLSLAFIFWFTRLIANPILQLDKHIRDLGNWRFDHEIKVGGPRDLKALGERLDWLRRQLAYLEKIKSEFLQSVSHELKTPLTAIRESAELLSEEVTGPLSKKQKVVCNILQKNSVSLQKMIEKLLSFNMNHASKGGEGKKNVYLAQVIEQVLTDHEPVILSKQLNVKKDLENWIYLANEDEIRTIVDNLLSNAVKYAPYGTTITISLRGKANQILLDVSDQGIGISNKDKKHVFDAFYRGEPPEKGVIKGSGLGLSIVKEFVEANHGSIELLEPGKDASGAHFRVSLPIASDEELAWVV